MARSVLAPCRLRALLACVMILALLAPSVAMAGTPYSIQWLRSEDDGSCETPDLGAHDGEGFFRVNDVPLPTYQVPGALASNADGSTTNLAEAGFDSVLLRNGANGFFFSVSIVSGDNSCVHAHEVASLVSVPLGIDKPLFDVTRNGTAFAGSTQLDLSLVEINPPLAQDIATFEAALLAQRKELFANAAQAADLASQLARLTELDAKLTALVSLPLDEIDPADLDELLWHYSDVVDDATRAAVVQLGITEIKGGNNIESSAVTGQIANVVAAIDKAGWRAEIEYVELIVKKGATFNDANWIAKDGYLYNVVKGRRISVRGFPTLFVRVTTP